jgi:hypothetical protein
VVSDLPAACLPEVLLVSLALVRLRPPVAAVLFPVFPALAPAPAVARSVSLERARFSVAAGQPVQQLAGSEAWVQPGPALQPEEPAARDVAVAASVAAEVPLQAAEPPGAAEAPQQEVQDGEAGQDAEVLQPEVPGGPAAELPSVERPSAVAWAFRRDQVLPWPEPQPVVRFARATTCLPIAAPSARWWQAATNEVLS